MERIAARDPSPKMLLIVSHYALHDPDPETETWQQQTGAGPMWGGDPHMDGINSVRGTAAGAIAALIFADRGCFLALEPAALAVIHHRSIAVRSCAAEILLAMLNFDRPRAVLLFLELCDGADAVLGTHHIGDFLHHACYDQYAELRDLMLRMLTLENKKAREAAATQITVASLHLPLAIGDFPRVLAADPDCRRSAAFVFAANLGKPRFAELCQQHLAQLFDDPNEEVRASAANCFRHLPATQVSSEEGLMRRFVESAACTENSWDLVDPLKDAATALPEIVCRLPERLIEEQRAFPENKHIESRRWTHDLPALIARLYEQTRDAAVETRCLNIIDDMLELGFSEIDQELEKVER